MNYEIGQVMMFIPDSKFDQPKCVEVIGLRKHGSAKLSNGWLVDADGIAEGTNRMPGGRVATIE